MTNTHTRDGNFYGGIQNVYRGNSDYAFMEKKQTVTFIFCGSPVSTVVILFFGVDTGAKKNAPSPFQI